MTGIAKIGLSSKVLQDRPLVELFRIAARCGYTGLELFGVPNHLPVDVPMERVREARHVCDDLGLRVVTLCPYVGGFAEASDREAQAELEKYRRYVEIAHLLGCDMIRLDPENLGRRIPAREDHWLRAAHYLGIAADIGLRERTRLLIENHEVFTISVEGTLRLIRLIDRPNVVVNFDPGNMHASGRAYGRDAVVRLFPLIGNVQVKDARRDVDAGGIVKPASPASYDVLLGEGNVDHLSYLRPLAELGYAGFYMAECHKVPTAELSSEQIAAREIEAIQSLIARSTCSEESSG